MNAVLAQSIEIRQEHYSSELVRELLPMLEKNWEESPTYSKEIRIAPDFKAYKAMDDQGRVLCLTARVNGRLIGYSIWYIITSFNYEGKSGHGVALYIEPEYRGQGAWLLTRGEAMLREKGITRFYWFARPGTLLHKLVSVLGYVADEVVMEKLK
jgi:GNAT superfamily N-acetyltransferase